MYASFSLAIFVDCLEAGFWMVFMGYAYSFVVLTMNHCDMPNYYSALIYVSFILSIERFPCIQYAGLFVSCFFCFSGISIPMFIILSQIAVHMSLYTS